MAQSTEAAVTHMTLLEGVLYVLRMLMRDTIITGDIQRGVVVMKIKAVRDSFVRPKQLLFSVAASAKVAILKRVLDSLSPGTVTKVNTNSIVRSAIVSTQKPISMILKGSEFI